LFKTILLRVLIIKKKAFNNYYALFERFSVAFKNSETVEKEKNYCF
jgi:hypothetical protein